MVTKQKIRLAFMVMALLLVPAFLVPVTPVAAAAEPCETIYHSAPVASEAAKAKAVELLKACHKGYDTDSCKGIDKSAHATKEERQQACKDGRAYRAVNPPDPGTTEDEPDVVLNDPVSGNDCGGVQTAIIKCEATNTGDKLENNGIWALLLIVINIMTAGVGVLAVAGIVYGSILYTTAEDKADQVNSAVNIIRNVVIGLVAFALMWAGLNFIIPGGVFSR